MLFVAATYSRGHAIQGWCCCCWCYSNARLILLPIYYEGVSFVCIIFLIERKGKVREHHKQSIKNGLPCVVSAINSI